MCGHWCHTVTILTVCGEFARRPRLLRRSRKVRTPQDRELGNAQAGRPDGKCHRDQTADGPFGHRQG